MKKTLSEYDFPEELKQMSIRDLDLLTYEIRDFLIENVAKTGGHLASNLGVVELTIALHRIFNSPRDKIIWDVGHQSYVHKILTGRSAQFNTLRQTGGLSGFPKREESCHDFFDTGHSSTSISAAAGIAAARDLACEDYEVIAVIGDGALTGGLSYEALNNVGDSKSKVIVVLNDNGMSISKNIGGMSQHLGKLRTSKTYQDLKKQIKKTIKGIPTVGEGLYQGMEHLRDSVKYAFVEGALFEELGLTYLGPVDGHNLEDLLDALTMARNVEGPVVVHAITKKGKGYKNAENNPNKFHGISPFDPTTGTLLQMPDGLAYSQIFGNKMIQLAAENEKIVAVCAAMISGTGLEKFAAKFPSRVFDVGIAEAHAVTFAAGLAQNGYCPVVAIYSTFLQRAYDQILIDVCMQNLPVVFALDRAGNVGSDGETHHGIFDLSYLSHMPNMTILCPKDGNELAEMLQYAVSLNSPCAVRYPRGGPPSFGDMEEVQTPINKSQVMQTGRDVEIWAVGRMVETGLAACNTLRLYGVDAGLVNVRTVKPLDEEAVFAAAARTAHIVTLEDNTLGGGFGQTLSSFLISKGIAGDVSFCSMGWPDRFIEHGSCGTLFETYGLDETAVAERIREFIEGKTGSVISK